jgi:hypothetical protein
MFRFVAFCLFIVLVSCSVLPSESSYLPNLQVGESTVDLMASTEAIVSSPALHSIPWLSPWLSLLGLGLPLLRKPSRKKIGGAMKSVIPYDGKIDLASFVNELVQAYVLLIKKESQHETDSLPTQK